MKKELSVFVGLGCLVLLLICCRVAPVAANVCFLASGECMDSYTSQEQSAEANDNCDGYGTKINGSGWDCSDTCSAHGHTYYKCVKKECVGDLEAGVSACPRGYDLVADGSYSGYEKCGKCVEDTCPSGTHHSQECEETGYMPVETQYYEGGYVCYTCVSDICDEGKKKKCDDDTELALHPSRTPYGSLCFDCCNNECYGNSSLEEPVCGGNMRSVVVGFTACGKNCYECRAD